MSLVKEKDPAATLDYFVDWSAWLGTDTLVGSTWTVPDGLVKEAESSANGRATVWISGGTVGARYELTNRISTAGGRTDERTLHIKCTNK